MLVSLRACFSYCTCKHLPRFAYLLHTARPLGSCICHSCSSRFPAHTSSYSFSTSSLPFYHLAFPSRHSQQVPTALSIRPAGPRVDQGEASCPRQPKIEEDAYHPPSTRLINLEQKPFCANANQRIHTSPSQRPAARLHPPTRKPGQRNAQAPILAVCDGACTGSARPGGQAAWEMMGSAGTRRQASKPIALAPSVPCLPRRRTHHRLQRALAP